MAVAEERTRIARELHDVVAHAMSVMVLQVGAVRHKLPEAYADERERSGTSSWRGGRPSPRCGGCWTPCGTTATSPSSPHTPASPSSARSWRRSGPPGWTWASGSAASRSRCRAGLDLSAYRILQEGLTNVLKHAHAGRAEVEVRYGQDEVRVVVRDDGAARVPADGLGHGLVGVAERVKLYGGEMTRRAARPAAGSCSVPGSR